MEIKEIHTDNNCPYYQVHHEWQYIDKLTQSIAFDKCGMPRGGDTYMTWACVCGKVKVVKQK